MCGILCICSLFNGENAGDANVQKIAEEFSNVLERRGPNSKGSVSVQLPNSWTANFLGTTLWLQGISPTQQPLTDSMGNILLWNGDAFYGEINGHTIPNDDCDSNFLLGLLQKTNTVQKICEILDSINGPWAIIYYNKQLNVIITGRDKLGRHSLLWNANPQNFDYLPRITDPEKRHSNLILTSATATEKADAELTEVPAHSIYQISFSETLVIEAVHSRTTYSINKEIPSESQLNWNNDYLADGKNVEHLFLQYTNTWLSELNRFESLIFESVKVRVECQPMLCKKCVEDHKNDDQKCVHSKIAILFSGGLDSTVLAALTDRVWPAEEPIDLLNVAFSAPTKPANHKNASSKEKSAENFNVPDRLTGLQALVELQTLNPSRQWNFVKIDIPLNELVAMRSARIASLIAPSSTVLDDSIGCAQWFAARGKGSLIVSTDCDDPLYCSPARVILMGAGADEQMAGYSRHRQRFSFGGWQGLLEELEMEMNRIPERNLGRDNRIIADHGRAPRLPYLDEKVVQYLASLPILAKADLRQPAGVGDKIILRVLAHRLGLPRTSLEPKRAIQFGSRIAKAEARKEKGSQVCDRLKTKS